jgi:hypothetical protein
MLLDADTDVSVTVHQLLYENLNYLDLMIESVCRHQTEIKKEIKQIIS